VLLYPYKNNTNVNLYYIKYRMHVETQSTSI
jgi:hypothetical protein